MSTFVVRADADDDRDVRKSFVTKGLESGFWTFIIRASDRELAKMGKIDALFTNDGEFIDDSIEAVRISDAKTQGYAMSLAGKKRIVVVETDDWKVIPVENVIGGFNGSDTEIYAVARTPAEAKLLQTTMEKGVDGIIIDVMDPDDIGEFAELVQTCGKKHLSEITITSVMPVEMGDRVCIDTCVSMSPGEGMLVGSYSNCLFLIQSESEESEYVASRPFRVNAGAVHSYIAMPDDSTKYLSEISGGDRVLLCDSEGNTRVATVGRCKIEKRPMLMVRATDGKRDYSVVLQNAETIRLVTPKGSSSVTEIGKGDVVLAELSTGGRHFGMSVDETVSEK